MPAVGWFQVVMGLAVAGLWAVLLLTGEVPEVQQGRVDIWFHVAAELAMATLLLAAGVAVLRRSGSGPLLSGLALGTLGYSAVNSPGYYAEGGDWVVVGGFALIVAATTAAFVVVWRRGAADEPSLLPQPGERASTTPAGAHDPALRLSPTGRAGGTAS